MSINWEQKYWRSSIYHRWGVPIDSTKNQIYSKINTHLERTYFARYNTIGNERIIILFTDLFLILEDTRIGSS